MSDSATGNNLLPRRVRHEIRIRRARVAEVKRVTPNRVRITLHGEDLVGFVSPGFDDHVKLIFPAPVTGVLPIPTLGAHGLAWPPGVDQPIMRDYTPRQFDAEAGTLAIGFSLHDAGPATDWARRAAPGDEIAVAGPRGSFIIPVEYPWHLLIGDETAIPAVARRLEELPPATRALVLLEVDDAADELPLVSQAALDLRWYHRSGAAPGTTSMLKAALADLTLPEGMGFAWIAGESSTVKTLRTQLVSERGMDPVRVRAAGYWRLGASNVHEHIEDSAVNA